MDGYRFSLPLRVRWAEVDAQNVVFNGHYMTYLDCANTDYLRKAVAPDETQDMLNVVVAKSTLEFHAPARFDDDLTVWCRVTHIGTSSLTFHYAITREFDDAVLLTAETVYVHVDPTTQLSIPVPKVWRDSIEQFEGASFAE